MVVSKSDDCIVRRMGHISVKTGAWGRFGQTARWTFISTDGPSCLTPQVLVLGPRGRGKVEHLTPQSSVLIPLRNSERTLINVTWVSPRGAPSLPYLLANVASLILTLPQVGTKRFSRNVYNHDDVFSHGTLNLNIFWIFQMKFHWIHLSDFFFF